VVSFLDIINTFVLFFCCIYIMYRCRKISV
jgi:hypothetical protein